MYGDRDNNTCAIPTCDPGRWTNTHERNTPVRYLSLKKFFEKILGVGGSLGFSSSLLLSFSIYIIPYFLQKVKFSQDQNLRFRSIVICATSKRPRMGSLRSLRQ